MLLIQHISPSVGDRQLQLTRALERSPSSSFFEAVESFVAWMVNAEQLLASEKFVVDELDVMEHQLSQCLVSRRVSCVSYMLVSQVHMSRSQVKVQGRRRKTRAAAGMAYDA